MDSGLKSKQWVVRVEPIEIGQIHPSKHEARQLVSIQQVPRALIDALIVTEDRHFYEHHGISLRAIARAFIANAREGKVVEGEPSEE